jgi:hypothetical protein
VPYIGIITLSSTYTLVFRACAQTNYHEFIRHGIEIDEWVFVLQENNIGIQGNNVVFLFIA